MKVLLTLLSSALVATALKSYEGYKVLRTGTLVVASSDILRQMQATSNTIDFWSEAAPGRQADIMVKSEELESFQEFLNNNNIQFHIMVQDVQNLIDEVESTRGLGKSKSNTKYSLDWNDYYDHDTINEFLDAMAAENEWANVITIGQSFEGRDMKVLAVTKAGPGAPNVWLEAGIHAREWISPAVATFIMRELVENNDEHPDYLDKINWYLIPSANPDGYMYSHEQERFWRKTRSSTGSIIGCKGVDPNRNWSFHFGESGVSNDKCSDIYPGPKAFSEIETLNIKNFLETLDPVPILGHSFHSYSQLWLWPYGYDYGVYPPNREEIEQLAIDASNALYQTLRPGPLTTGTVGPSAQGSPSPPSSETREDTVSSCQPTRLSPVERRCGPA